MRGPSSLRLGFGKNRGLLTESFGSCPHRLGGAARRSTPNVVWRAGCWDVHSCFEVLQGALNPSLRVPPTHSGHTQFSDACVAADPSACALQRRCYVSAIRRDEHRSVGGTSTGACGAMDPLFSTRHGPASPLSPGRCAGCALSGDCRWRAFPEDAQKQADDAALAQLLPTGSSDGVSACHLSPTAVAGRRRVRARARLSVWHVGMMACWHDGLPAVFRLRMRGGMRPSRGVDWGRTLLGPPCRRVPLSVAFLLFVPHALCSHSSWVRLARA